MDLLVVGAGLFGLTIAERAAEAGLHVTVTEVRASPDLKHMTAFVSGLGRDLTDPQMRALRRASPTCAARWPAPCG